MWVDVCGVVCMDDGKFGKNGYAVMVISISLDGGVTKVFYDGLVVGTSAVKQDNIRVCAGNEMRENVLVRIVVSYVELNYFK